MIIIMLYVNTYYIKALRYIYLSYQDAKYTTQSLFICHYSETLPPCFEGDLTSSYTFSYA